MHDPDVGPLLQALSSSAISSDVFNSRLMQTPWYKSHAASQRAWEITQNTDPASAAQQVTANTAQIAQRAGQLGVHLPWQALHGMAGQMAMYGWNSQQIDQALLAAANLGNVTGSFQTGEQSVQALANDYGQNISQQAAFGMQKQIEASGGSVNDLRAQFSKQALALYPHLAEQLNAGLSLKDIASPYVSAASQTLEIDPRTINMADPKWNRALAFHDGKQVRNMSMYDWNKTMMTDPTYGYDHSVNGRSAALQMAQGLAQTFGFAT
jgi:hypothetical protein